MPRGLCDAKRAADGSPASTSPASAASRKERTLAWQVVTIRGIVIAIRRDRCDAEKVVRGMMYDPWECTVEEVDDSALEPVRKHRKKSLPSSHPFTYPPDLDLKRKPS